ncbi:MAG: flagellin [Acidimicrobiales bacterium]
MRINQNIEALNAWRNLSNTNTEMGKSLEKLSSGFRINRAADDASGLVISQGLRAQVSGLQQATRNAQDGISVVQTAEGALNEIHSMLNRMRDLSVQAANTGTNDSNARTAANAEVTQLSAEIDRISSSTKFGQQALLDGTFGVTAATKTGFNATGTVTLAGSPTFTINVNGVGAKTVTLTAGTYTGAQLASHMQNAIRTALTSGGTYTQAQANAVTVDSTTVGAGFSLSLKAQLANTQTFTLADGTNTPLATLNMTGAITAASGTGGTFQVGANSGDTIAVALASVSTTGLGVNGLDLVNNASGAITALDSAISSVSTTRGNLGAIQNRFESTINNLQVTTENLSASESRIRDTDMASEMTQFTRHQVLLQAGTAMLAQANQLPQTVLRLLQ